MNWVGWPGGWASAHHHPPTPEYSNAIPAFTLIHYCNPMCENVYNFYPPFTILDTTNLNIKLRNVAQAPDARGCMYIHIYIWEDTQ